MGHSSNPPSSRDKGPSSISPPSTVKVHSSTPPSWRGKVHSSTPPAARFKGTVLRPLKPWMEGTFGADAVQAAFASMPDELSGGLTAAAPHFGALPATWYDARIYRHLFDELLRGRGDDEAALDEMANTAAHAVLEQTLRGIYARLFGLMASPPLYARYAQKMWDTHYDTGRVAVEQLTPTVALHRVTGWAGHHRFVCAVNRQSGIVLYKMMGLQNVRIERQRCTSPVCEAQYAWDP